MKKIVFRFILAAAAIAVVPVVAQTNLPVRTLSLEDCIGQALKQNFDVQVERYDPQINLYSLYATYGGFDPVLTLAGVHSYNSTPGSFTSELLQTPSSTSEGNSFNGDLSGVLPEGLQYDISGNVYKNNDAIAAFGTNSLASRQYNSAGSIGIQLTQP
jgi:hypothetical protein